LKNKKFENFGRVIEVKDSIVYAEGLLNVKTEAWLPKAKENGCVLVHPISIQFLMFLVIIVENILSPGDNLHQTDNIIQMSIIGTIDEFFSSIETKIIGRPLTAIERLGITIGVTIVIGFGVYSFLTYDNPIGQNVPGVQNVSPPFPDNLLHPTIVEDIQGVLYTPIPGQTIFMVSQNIIENIIDNSGSATAAAAGAAATIASAVAQQVTRPEFSQLLLDIFNARHPGFDSDIGQLFMQVHPKIREECGNNPFGFLIHLAKDHPILILHYFSQFESETKENTIQFVCQAYEQAYGKKLN